MKWVDVKEVAELTKKSMRTIRLYITNGKLQHRQIKGKGRGGVKYEVNLNSVYEQFPFVKYEKNNTNSLINYTGKQREKANHKAMIIEMYWQSKMSSEQFVSKYNEDNTDEHLTVNKLLRWQAKYTKHRNVENLIDKRGNVNKGKFFISSDIWQYFYDCYMTQQQRSIKLCYDLTVKKFGKNIPSLSTFERKVKKIPHYAIIQYRFGEKALRDNLPSMERGRSDILSNDIWCSDHHLIDSFVKSENGKKAVRLWLTVFHDMKSNKIISYIARNASPNATVVKKCFKKGVEEYGIPNEVYFDNGKDYKSKCFSSDYPMSLVHQLGFNIIYATPYHGQAKPTERFFRTFEDRFSKLFPTYAGCNAKNRPECMQTKEKKIIDSAPSIEEYSQFLEQYIQEYNNTPSKATGLNNQTPNKVYYENLKFKRQIKDKNILNILCGTVYERTVHKNGITVNNQTYRSDYLIPYLKNKVYVVFDSDNIDEVSVFDMENKAICTAQATIVSMFRHTTEEDYRRAAKERKAVRDFNKKYQPTREYSIFELIEKQKFSELKDEKNKEVQAIDYINPKITANANTLNATKKENNKMEDNHSIANSLLEYYENQRKGC